ncbi:hypothetical protein FACS189437_06840 [Bacteroidia bacterium]|nr:hypothetical protein FACS189437_06840 [Bacteroidia bacterium]
MNAITDINKFKVFFADVIIFTTDDIARFYRQENPDISRSAVNWHITKLVRKGIIRRTNRGVYERSAHIISFGSSTGSPNNSGKGYNNYVRCARRL